MSSQNNILAAVGDVDDLKKVKAVKRIKTVKRIIVLLLLYQILGGLISSMIHLNLSYEESEGKITLENVLSDNEGPERVLCLDDNVEALVWRLCAIEQAEEEIILSTFDIKTDNSGTDILSALYEAAERGVKVKILDDGMTGTLRLKNNDTFRAIAAHPNIEARLYNPINLLKPYRYTFRLHDKYLIIDNKLYISGGRNTYDLFLGDYSDHSNIDRDLLIYETDENAKNTSLAEIKSYFYSLWDSSYCRQLAGKENEAEVLHIKEHYATMQSTFPQVYEVWNNLTAEEQEERYIELSFPTNRITYLDNGYAPKVRKPVLLKNLVTLMERGDEVIMQTPYIVCNSYMYQGMERISSAVSSFEIITNAVENGANPWGCTDYLNEKENILQTGVIVYEYLGEHSIHNKAILIDDRISIIGSYNLDMRSTYLDTEMMLVVDSTELNQYLRENISDVMDSGNRVQAGEEDRPGSNYKAREMTVEKKRFYAVLRVFIRGFRYLL